MRVPFFMMASRFVSSANSKIRFSSGFIALFATLLCILPGRADEGGSPVGFWKSSDATFQLYEEDGKLNGKIVALKSPLAPDGSGREKLDVHNPDPAKRDRKIKGIVFMVGLTKNKSGKWENGKIYDPQSGNTYAAQLEFQGTGQLKIRGYLGVSALGRTEVWDKTEAVQ